MLNLSPLHILSSHVFHIFSNVAFVFMLSVGETLGDRWAFGT